MFKKDFDWFESLVIFGNCDWGYLYEFFDDNNS